MADKKAERLQREANFLSGLINDLDRFGEKYSDNPAIKKVRKEAEGILTEIKYDKAVNLLELNNNQSKAVKTREQMRQDAADELGLN